MCCWPFFAFLFDKRNKFECFKTFQPLGPTVKRLDFQKNLSKVMNNNYWTKTDYRNHNLSKILDKNDAQVVEKKIGSVKTKNLIDIGKAPDVKASVEPAVSNNLIGGFGKRLKPQVREEGSRLVSGPKQKEHILAKYQAEFGKGKSIVTTAQGKLPLLNFEPPSQCHLIRSCRMKPDLKKSYSVEDPGLLNIVVFFGRIFVE